MSNKGKKKKEKRNPPEPEIILKGTAYGSDASEDK